MGNALARYSRTVPSRTATPAAFPPSPSVAPRTPTSLQAPEIERNRKLTDMLNASTILTQSQPSSSETSPSTPFVAVEGNANGIPSDELAKLLMLHAQKPGEWDAAALARKFGLPDEAVVATALKYVKPFHINEDNDRGRAIAVHVKPDSAAPEEGKSTGDAAAVGLVDGKGN